MLSSFKTQHDKITERGIYMSNQHEEVKTIKERNISIKLSDADVERLCNKLGEAGLTVSELLENLVGDLVDGTYSNGSDERMYANQWFDRCWFGMDFGEMSFLQWLITNDTVSEAIDEWTDLQFYKEQEELDENDIEDIAFIKESLNDLFGEYKGEKISLADCSLENEMVKVMHWHEEKRKLKGAENGITYRADSESPVPELLSDGLTAVQQELTLQDKFIPDEMPDEEMEMSL